LNLRTTRAHLSVYDSASMYRMDWTDGRLQERFDSIDRRFDQVDQRFDQVDRRFEQVDQRFEQVDQRFEQVDQRFDRVDQDFRELRSEMTQRFDSLQRVMVQGVITLSGAFIAGFAALIVLIATKL
jgi:septation ring formation regulator EzrA